MTLKTCPSGHIITTRNARSVEFTYWPELKKAILWFTCPVCRTTLTLSVKRPNYAGPWGYKIKE